MEVPLSGVEIGIALSGVALRLSVLLQWRALPWLAVALVAVFAIFHGYAHGAELPESSGPMSYAAGFVLSTGLLHLCGILLGLLILWKPVGGYMVRALGAFIMVSGAYFLWNAFAG